MADELEGVAGNEADGLAEVSRGVERDFRFRGVRGCDRGADGYRLF